MINQIIHLFSPSYLFHRSLGPFQSNLAYIMISFCVLLIILAIITPKLAKNKDRFAKKAIKKYSSLSWTMGTIGIILYIFRQINVLYLSAPVFVLFWGVSLVFWAFYVLRYCFCVVPKRRLEVEKEDKKKEYIP